MSESRLFPHPIPDWLEQVKKANVGYCAHCEAREKLADDLIARLNDHTGTYYFSDDEADELASAVEFMRAEGYW